MEKQLSFIYSDFNLDELFIKETDILDKVMPYCNRTNKIVKSSYSFSTLDPLKFKLEISVKN